MNPVVYTKRRARDVFACGFPAARLVIELRLNICEERLIYDRIMQAGAGRTAMHNLAEIEPVLQEVEEGAAAEGLISHDPAFLRDMTL